jgi:hypothetical protein
LQETERLRKLSLANKCVQKWQVETRRTQERLFSFIAVQSLSWREKAKRTVLLRQQELQDESAVLLDIEQRKASGFPLSLSEVGARVCVCVCVCVFGLLRSSAWVDRALLG